VTGQAALAEALRTLPLVARKTARANTRDRPDVNPGKSLLLPRLHKQGTEPVVTIARSSPFSSNVKHTEG
jgi:hypothetical protein